MKLLLCPLFLALALTSCESGPNARTGTAVGALGGAAAGGVIGHQSGRGVEGALIGAGAGALAGNAIGGSQDRSRDGRAYTREERRAYENRADNIRDERPTYGSRDSQRRGDYLDDGNDWRRE